ncbi:AraC family transcriptional regulator [Pseudomonas massiliensis]|uniref:AraC family transcriptional regulator n=1 Tax=Pseudomonas massiliensis TaxID=522492 RepID=UPI000A075C86|nr:AraC family transcriptional regulator [Pseudomonas massiliensis]
MSPASLSKLIHRMGGEGAPSLDALLATVAPLGPLLDVVPNAAIFIKDDQARYVLANRALVERCGLKFARELLGKTSAQVFPARFGPGYTEQDKQVLEQGRVLEGQLELHLYGSQEPGWCLTYKWPLDNGNGVIYGLAGISLDLQTAGHSHPAYQRLAAVDTYIREHFSGPISLATLTDIAGISAAQLERYCKRVFQLSPRQMIQKARLEHARELLQGRLPIIEVALRCGYTDHSAFTRQFKTLTGFTPRHYRQAISG